MPVQLTIECGSEFSEIMCPAAARPQVILTLLAFKVLYPGHFHLTRGNHESKSMNKIYGFEGEGPGGSWEDRLDAHVFCEFMDCLMVERPATHCMQPGAMLTCQQRANTRLLTRPCACCLHCRRGEAQVQRADVRGVPRDLLLAAAGVRAQQEGVRQRPSPASCHSPPTAFNRRMPLPA